MRAPPPLRLGSRSSRLALAQARTVAAAIGATRAVEIVTRGDRPEPEAPDKRRWVAGIERALLDRQIDLAVHSAKDVPVERPAGLALVGAPRRADARDALCGARSLGELGRGARVGTSSLRRTAQLRALRPDLELCQLHGNVDTRLDRLHAGHFDAIVLAMAGLDRLELDAGVPLDELVPAPGQGTLLLEAREDDTEARAAIQSLRDAPAEAALAAERALVGALGAGCHTPLGAHARRRGDGLELRAFVGLPDGSAWIRDELVGDEPQELGRELARRLLSAGAGKML